MRLSALLLAVLACSLQPQAVLAQESDEPQIPKEDAHIERPAEEFHIGRPADYGVEAKSIVVSGEKRDYYVHLPKSYDKSKATPLVLLFHGSGGNALKNDRLSHFNATADAHNFIVVYPQGINRHWNDGREVPGEEEHDDLSFVKAMLTELEKDWNIDKHRIYCCGISNGGFFSQFVALHIPDKIAAIVSVAASMSDKMVKMEKPSRPVPIMYILGDQDPLVIYNGGEIKMFNKRRGKCIPALDAVNYWLTADGCNDKAVLSQMPDIDPGDGTHVEKAAYTDCKDGSEVVLLTVRGGGHTWPSGMQYLPEIMIGKTTKDLNNEVIWNFMSAHHR